MKNPGEQNERGQAEDPSMLTPVATRDNQQASSKRRSPAVLGWDTLPLPSEHPLLPSLSEDTLGQALPYRWPAVHWEFMQKALTTQSLGTAASLCPQKHS